MTRPYGDDYDQWQSWPTFEPTARRTRRPCDRRVRERDLEALDPDVAAPGNSGHRNRRRRRPRLGATGVVASQERLVARTQGGGRG